MGVNIINNFPPGSAGGGYVSPVPEFAYTGQYQMLDDGNGDWRLKLLTSGVLTFLGEGDLLVDVFLVGGGGNGGAYMNGMAYGGGGGYTRTELNQVLMGKLEYTVTIGAAAGRSSLGAYSVNGGMNADSAAGNGGSGGAVCSTTTYYARGGSNGADGSKYGDNATKIGKGQGSTTCEFAESNGEVYSNGGHADYNGIFSKPYTKTNMGHGGHGVFDSALRSGQPGIVIIRNHRRAA